jgi:hypothetical protein
VDGARLREHPHNRAEHLLEVERRRDRRDDLGEDSAFCGCRRGCDYEIVTSVAGHERLVSNAERLG